MTITRHHMLLTVFHLKYAVAAKPTNCSLQHDMFQLISAAICGKSSQARKLYVDPIPTKRNAERSLTFAQPAWQLRCMMCCICYDLKLSTLL